MEGACRKGVYVNTLSRSVYDLMSAKGTSTDELNVHLGTGIRHRATSLQHSLADDLLHIPISSCASHLMNPLPRHAYLSPQGKDRQAELTRQGVYNLIPSEVFWQSRQQFLKKKGYILRRRYHPDWHPSWVGTNLDPTYCEDSILLSVSLPSLSSISSF